MNYRNFLLSVAAGLLALSCGSLRNSKTCQSSSPRPGVEDREMGRFISCLMSKMTLDEKIGQLNLPTYHSDDGKDIVTGSKINTGISESIRSGDVGGLLNARGYDVVHECQKIAVEQSRLGIPLIFGLDVIHGYETVFPIPLAMASSWDTSGIRKAARISAVEASADGICWTFSPMVDISRDPRWGRVAEGAGEDPFLGSAIAASMVKGFQGPGNGKIFRDSTDIMACIKHFALYGAVEAGRDYNTTDMSFNRMYNEYLPPYKAAVDAGAGSVMTSFNDINGIPATANKWLLTDLLRNQWGFKGFVVTDYTAIAELQNHGLGDLQTASALALKAGVDMDMVSEGFTGTLKKSIEEGRVTKSEIDAACRKVLEAKYKLGLFKNPYRYIDKNRRSKDIYTPAHRNLARKLAGESIVLLENGSTAGGSKPLLPLSRKGTIAVIGPLADAGPEMTGTWSVASGRSYTSLYQGIKEVAGPDVKVLYAKGCNLDIDAAAMKRDISRMEFEPDPYGKLISDALETASRSDVIVAALGECADMSGESSCRTSLVLPSVQHTLLEALLKTGKPVVLVLFSGRPTVLSWEKDNVPAILNVWFEGSEGAFAISDVLFGDVNPSGKLTMSFPKNVGQIPIYYNHKNTGRPLPEGGWYMKYRSNYIDVDNDPLYPFGYGLSYTDFVYSHVSLSSSVLNRDSGSVTASVKVSNTGDRDGDEVVQLYIRDIVASVTRPVKELKGFKRVHIPAHSSMAVSFKITPDLLKFYNAGLEHVCEPGEFEIMTGPDSENVTTANLFLKGK
ncbi:MAG: beta-glucosidase BglX [Bacteroidales bacterium]|nr:beta-glucosidase BglX [Bacteroidales bacterium]MCI1785742.1 beta-glucosidase BglX [Bacteroidales bacterium]